MCGVLALIFILTTAAEVVLLVVVGGHIGALPTLGIIIATGCLGAFLAKRAGAAALRRLQRSMVEGGTSLALVNGALVLAAGVTLLSPGFITDALGLLLLVGPVRAVVATLILDRVKAKAFDIGVEVIDPSAFVGGNEDPPPPGVIDV